MVKYPGKDKKCDTSGILFTGYSGIYYYIELQITRELPEKIDKLFIYSLNSYFLIKYLKLRINDIS